MAAIRLGSIAVEFLLIGDCIDSWSWSGGEWGRSLDSSGAFQSAGFRIRQVVFGCFLLISVVFYCFYGFPLFSVLFFEYEVVFHVLIVLYGVLLCFYGFLWFSIGLRFSMVFYGFLRFSTGFYGFLR